jgi:DNA-binding HxlR family transcriptional regulator
LAANTVNGSGNGARSGAQTLTLLAAPLNTFVLRALSNGPRRQSGLQREAGFPAQSTLRAQLKRLVEIGTVEKHRRNRFPGVLEYELTASGRDLFLVVDVLERWLERAPAGRLSLGDNAARTTVKALAEGWSTTMLRALAAGPRSLTELDSLISSHSYPSLERRLGSMRLAGLVESCSGDGRGTPYAVTTWTREAVAPLAAAAQWEQRHLVADAPPVARLDAEAAFLLAVPLIKLPSGLTGSCRMAAEIPSGKGQRLAGVKVMVQDGATASCTTHLQGETDAWALGSPTAWLGALVEHDSERLELGGDCPLVRALVEGLHGALFRAPVEKSL